jgi:probable phosphoglycerate mutase
MKTIIFIRHGESMANSTYTLTSDNDGYPLTDAGRAQAAAIAGTIRNAKISGFYTSPVLRAVQTARIISERCGIAPKVDERLRERRMGGLNGKGFRTHDELCNALIEELRSGSKDGFETWKDLQSRTMHFVESVDRGIAVAVTHHDVIMAALGAIDSRYEDGDFTTGILTGSATTVDFENKRIIGINSRTVPRLDAK